MTKAGVPDKGGGPDHAVFATAGALDDWLAQHHADRAQLWVRIYKKASGVASVDWQDCVIAALCWGWIDGQKKALDDLSYLQRLTPRTARSGWSDRNRQHAERLIAEGRMQPPGLAQVTAAKADGRWHVAYAGQADMVIPQDFLDALQAHPVAKAFYATLNRSNLFAIYHRLHPAKRPQTRQDRMQRIIDQLNRQERFH